MSCMICFDELTPANRVQLDCAHRFCRNCIFQVVRVNSLGFDIGLIRCPALECLRPISDALIERAAQMDASGKTLELFGKAKRQRVLLQNPSLCECPGCCSLCPRPSAPQTKVNCGNCKLTFCPECFLEATDPHLCPIQPADFFAELSQSKRVLNCPRCSLRIEKIDGCNQMRCPMCRTEFCWVCGNKKGSHHYAFWNVLGCPGQALRSQSPLAYRIASFLLILAALLCLGGLAAWVWRWEELRSALLRVAVLDVAVVGAKRLGWRGPDDCQYLLLHLANQLLGDSLWQQIGI